MSLEGSAMSATQKKGAEADGFPVEILYQEEKSNTSATTNEGKAEQWEQELKAALEEAEKGASDKEISDGRIHTSAHAENKIDFNPTINITVTGGTHPTEQTSPQATDARPTLVAGVTQVNNRPVVERKNEVGDAAIAPASGEGSAAVVVGQETGRVKRQGVAQEESLSAEEAKPKPKETEKTDEGPKPDNEPKEQKTRHDLRRERGFTEADEKKAELESNAKEARTAYLTAYETYLREKRQQGFFGRMFSWNPTQEPKELRQKYETALDALGDFAGSEAERRIGQKLDKNTGRIYNTKEDALGGRGEEYKAKKERKSISPARLRERYERMLYKKLAFNGAQEIAHIEEKVKYQNPSMAEKAVGALKKAGEFYRKLPPGTRYVLLPVVFGTTGALMGGGGVVFAAGAAGAAVLRKGISTLAGMGAGTAVESIGSSVTKALKERGLKNTERTFSPKKLSTALQRVEAIHRKERARLKKTHVLAAGAAITAGMSTADVLAYGDPLHTLGKVSNLFKHWWDNNPGLAPAHAPAYEKYAVGDAYDAHTFFPGSGPGPIDNTGTISSSISSGTNLQTPSVPHTPLVFDVHKGDNMWNLFKDVPGIKDLSPAQQTLAVDYLKDRLVETDPQTLRGWGISSGKPDLVRPGEHIALGSSMDKQLVDAIAYAKDPTHVPVSVAHTGHTTGVTHHHAPLTHPNHDPWWKRPEGTRWNDFDREVNRQTGSTPYYADAKGVDTFSISDARKLILADFAPFRFTGEISPAIKAHAAGKIIDDMFGYHSNDFGNIRGTLTNGWQFVQDKPTGEFMSSSRFGNPGMTSAQMDHLQALIKELSGGQPDVWRTDMPVKEFLAEKVHVLIHR